MLFMVNNYNQYSENIQFLIPVIQNTCLNIISSEQMTFQQTILYPLQIPEFFDNFKNSCLQIILPKLIWLKDYLQSPSTEDQLDPIFLIVIAFITFQVFHTVYHGLFVRKVKQSELPNPSYSIQISRQMIGLKKQLKNMQQSLIQMIKQVKNQKKQTIKFSKKPKNNSNLCLNLMKSCKKLLPVYQSAIQNNKNLAMYIIESQQQIFRQLKKLKKNRISLSSSRPSHGSTIRQSSILKRQKTSSRKQKALVTKSLYNENVAKRSQIVAHKFQEQFLVKQIKSQVNTTQEEVKIGNNGIKDIQFQNKPYTTNINEQQRFAPIQNQHNNQNFKNKTGFKETKIVQNLNSHQQKQNAMQKILDEPSNNATEQVQQKQAVSIPVLKKPSPPFVSKNMQKRRVPPPPPTKK